MWDRARSAFYGTSAATEQRPTYSTLACASGAVLYTLESKPTLVPQAFARALSSRPPLKYPFLRTHLCYTVFLPPSTSRLFRGKTQRPATRNENRPAPGQYAIPTTMGGSTADSRFRAVVAPGFGTPPPKDQRPHSAAGRLGSGPGPGAYDVVCLGGDADICIDGDGGGVLVFGGACFWKSWGGQGGSFLTWCMCML